MKLSIHILIASSMILASCGTTTNKQEGSAEEVAEESHDHANHQHGSDDNSDMDGDKKASPLEMTHVKSTTITKGILDTYLELKNSLVNSDDDMAAEAGKKLVVAFEDFDKSTLTSDEQAEFSEIVENASEQAEHIGENAGNIVHQREHFEVLGTDMRDLVILVGTDRTLYQTFCPMYNKKKGGIWLSEEKEVKNPFYGHKMLNCGKVQSEIMPL